ncbi:MerR family transcriptional regulator [Candidatus Galacturonibacter soehngenii]|uniref:MerR family transcriptional regulator n=1 Tax=Candidatus Galacturonatibacter soehngenii TaxID=2307010 RepID=A0A7V7QJK8_9FIRM|nr:MerR family transcriptional regulator [Candidatus Galacturonibacter soehngenii]KAB1437829.1 MerR family transcriptional regulator [Candidatus Galacturonibacter soehngenii]MBA4687402.1 MerR family transcriptional regulator [Candidatus Galacturonibacter soehngenii]
MLTIGEFSNICKVSTKTLRYYAEIGLILPDAINEENGYRYYSIEQLEKMLFINRLKSYHFSLEEIKEILKSEEQIEEKLFLALAHKKKDMEQKAKELDKTLQQLDHDLAHLKQGKSIMSYLEEIEVQLVEVPKMYLMSIRKMVHEYEFADEYKNSFCNLFQKIQNKNLTMYAPPMVLFHSAEFSPLGLDTEFAIPIVEYAKGTRDFTPGLCLKTVLKGSYSNLSSVYAKQREWAETKGYESSNALYEVYITDPSQVESESELITEVYYPVRKKAKTN